HIRREQTGGLVARLQQCSVFANQEAALCDTTPKLRESAERKSFGHLRPSYQNLPQTLARCHSSRFDGAVAKPVIVARNELCRSFHQSETSVKTSVRCASGTGR